MAPISPNTINEPKLSQMFVFRNITDTTPTAQLVICSGIANFFFNSFNATTITSNEVRFAIPNLTVSEGQVLETTTMVSIASLGNQNLQGTPPPSQLSWSIDSAQSTQDGTQVVVDVNISINGAQSFIFAIAYHVTVLLRTTP